MKRPRKPRFYQRPRVKTSSTIIECDDEPPHSKTPKRIDSHNWRVCDLSADELKIET